MMTYYRPFLPCYFNKEDHLFYREVCGLGWLNVLAQLVHERSEGGAVYRHPGQQIRKKIPQKTKPPDLAPALALRPFFM